MTDIKTFHEFSKSVTWDNVIECDATEHSKTVLDNATLGDILYCVQIDGPEGLTQELFTSAYKAAVAFLSEPLRWDRNLARDHANEFMRQAHSFLDAPFDYEASFHHDEGWGSAITVQLYAVEIVA